MGYEIFREIDLFHNNFVKFHEIFVKYKNLNQFHEMFSAIRLSKLLPIFTPFKKNLEHCGLITWFWVVHRHQNP